MYTKIFFTYLSIARFGFARGSVISGLDFGQGHGKGLDDLLGVGRDNRVPYLVAGFSEPCDVQAVEAFRFGLGRGETGFSFSHSYSHSYVISTTFLSKMMTGTEALDIGMSTSIGIDLGRVRSEEVYDGEGGVC